MACSYGLLISLLTAIPGLASPLQEVSAFLPTAPQLHSASNLSALTMLNASSPNTPSLVVHCSGEHFGFNPDLTDCGSAKGFLSPDHEQHTWGVRHTGQGPGILPLPYRIMGGQ